MTIKIYKTVVEQIQALADHVIMIAQNVITIHGEFNIALAGGNSPKELYELLATDEYQNKIDWSKVNFFFGDERYVPADDKQSNSWMVQKSLFKHLNISSSQIFKVDTSLTPEQAAKKYDETIMNHFKQLPVRFDLMLLGLGDNSHTASLFPFTSVLSEKSPTVKAIFIKEQNSYRITMTAPLINQSQHIAFLVYGKEKAEAVYHVLKDVRNAEKYPAQLINPDAGELQWFLDKDAALLLNIDPLNVNHKAL